MLVPDKFLHCIIVPVKVHKIRKNPLLHFNNNNAFTSLHLLCVCFLHRAGLRNEIVVCRRMYDT